VTRRLPNPPLLVITDQAMTADLIATVAGALQGGARWIMLREKNLAPAVRLALARQVKFHTANYHASLSINTDLDTALAIGAEGLHLPSDLLCQDSASARRYSHLLRGASVHDDTEVARAVAMGVDYLVVAPVFITDSKPRGRAPLGLAGLKAMVAKSPIPVIALGGITPQLAPACLAAGANGIATMGAVMRAADPGGVVRDFLKEMSWQ